jgi:hypothetical protein
MSEKYLIVSRDELKRLLRAQSKARSHAKPSATMRLTISEEKGYDELLRIEKVQDTLTGSDLKQIAQNGLIREIDARIGG